MKRIPGATYRLQFNREFTLRQASEILGYLSELGISDIYASPLLEAGPQSTHGYDTCSFDRLNPNLGSAEDFERLTSDLKNRTMGLLLDVVPNHMSATLANVWWSDVLQEGRESVYAEFFDIDWQPKTPALQNKVLLPVLEDHYGKVLESRKLRLAFDNGKFFIAYHDRNFPVRAESVPAGNAEAVLKELNGTPGNARSFDKLDAVIERQHYRLAYWKVASEEINYRRFFDVTEMVALKMELPEVFQETHRLIFEWLKAGQVTGLRIDHPDGLWNPKEYLERLQAGLGDSAEGRPLYVVVEKILSGNERLPADWPADGTTGYDFLNRVNGLFVNGFNALAIREIYHKFTGRTESFADMMFDCRKRVLERSFASELNASTHRLHKIALGTRSGRDFTFSELRGAIVRVAANFPVYRTYITEGSSAVSDQDRAVIRKAAQDARERLGSQVDNAAVDFIERMLLLDFAGMLDDAASKDAREFVMKFQQLSGPAMAKGLEDTAFYKFNQLISLNEVGGDPGKFGVTIEEFHEANSATMKSWPHTMLASATHDTKRGEDARARLDVLSEMPVEWHTALGSWSRLNRDKKITVGNATVVDANDEYLLYQTLIGAWQIEAVDSQWWKPFCERITAFMLKAAKEAKVHTSWTEPNAAYEKALQEFLGQVLSEESNKAFINEIGRFARKVAFFGRFNSLSQTLLKITSPGVPDFYQGCVLWDLNLVDPDNRRPVDFALRQNLLVDVKKSADMTLEELSGFFGVLLREERPGMMKMFLVWRALNYRRALRELFDEGDYVPLVAEGQKQKHVCAFARQTKDLEVIVVVPRLVLGLNQGKESPPMGLEPWTDTILRVPSARVGDVYRNVLTQETVSVIELQGKPALGLAEILNSFPVALLEKT